MYIVYCIVFIHHCTMYLRHKPKIDYIDYIVILYTFCKQNHRAKTISTLKTIRNNFIKGQGWILEWVKW